MKYAKMDFIVLASAVTLSAVSIPQQEVHAAEVKTDKCHYACDGW